MSIGLRSGLRAMLTAQSVLDTIGHNISNANTPGYSRQRVNLSAVGGAEVRGMLLGQGVQIDGVSRSVDELLLGRIRDQLSVRGKLDVQLGHMLEVESFFSEANQGGIGNLMNAMFTSFSELSTSPNDEVLRVGTVQSAVDFTSRVRDVAATLDGIQGNIRGQLDIHVSEANRLIAEISEVNVRIAEAKASGLGASDLLDQRSEALRSLSEFVDVTVLGNLDGAVRVVSGGATIVGLSEGHPMQVIEQGGQLSVRVQGSPVDSDLKGGSIGGLIGFQDEFGPGLAENLDLMMRNLILEANRVHSTGVPPAGGFERLVADNRIVDNDGNGSFLDERLNAAGLPFDVSEGELVVNITDDETGEMVRHTITLTEATTVSNFLDDINAIPELSASVDSLGHLHIDADAGKRFDFSGRLDTNPDDAQGFGSGHASLGSSVAGPFGLVDGSTLDITAPVGGASFSITFSNADFDVIGAATAEEMAAVINADTNAQAAGVRATAQGGRLFLQSAGAGASEGFTLDGGSAVGAMGWGSLVGTDVLGSDHSSSPVLSGEYTGTENGQFTFVPLGDGMVGTTPGLQVDVYDSAGNRVATLDVGDDYTPGTELEVASGVSVAFGIGELSATHNDAFSVELAHDSDETDVLVALGLNTFFSGSGSRDIDVRAAIVDDPALIASSGTGFEGNNTTLLEILDLQTDDVAGLDNASLNVFYANFVGTLGFEVSSVQQGMDSAELMLGNLEARSQQISGVNVDEELVDLYRFEQAFAAAAQYVSVLQQLDDTLLNII